ncbi:shikimate dehydrogenase [Chloracidobacterium sp. MS 40/45]|uniref:shikimate dehydrogenase n=1 Tax=Chloracidobacterium aggregatum TaxID=2851959 RepID=UPI001B8C21E3|nr:shikimate dehydrogenase [Chloracidobacterium aggregatum]QUV99771.1 shikimate dehydrogenase [Chloracidobacterium sp. MS 40/45]
MICTPIAAPTPADMLAALPVAAATADWLELRLDAMHSLPVEAVLQALHQSLPRCPRPVVVTFRPREHGGFRDLSRADRLRFWHTALTTPAEAFDLETDLIAHLLPDYPPDHPVWARVVVSHHDFHATPADIHAFALAHFPPHAGAVKLAVKVNRPDDVCRLFHWLTGTPSTWQKIPVGMGGLGVLTRILGPAYGARWTYTTAHDGQAVAPGQLTATELRETFRLPSLDRHTTVAGLLGCPVAHSLSKDLHNAAFAHLGCNWVYIPVEVSPDNLAPFLRDAIHPRTRRLPWTVGGYSVTLPHKVAILPYLDRLTATAARVGAVNTILVSGQELIGDNTDVAGAMRPLQQRFALAGEPVAVLGAGGAAQAVVCGLVAAGARVTVFARHPARAQDLGARFGVPLAPLDDFHGRRFTGLVNTTPVGMAGHAEGACPVPPERLEGLAWVYDLIYRPRHTSLLQAASQQGIATLDGLPMLIAQAAEQLARWTGQDIPETVLFAAAERALHGFSPAS